MTTTNTYWVSFADEDGCLGVAIVDLAGDRSAKAVIEQTIARGCNPGYGDVQIQQIPPEDYIPAQFKNRLLSVGEARQITRMQ